jgi:hypothetical protein
MSVRQADHWSRGVLPSLVCLISVVIKPRTRKRKTMTPNQVESPHKIKVCMLNVTKFAMMWKFGTISDISKVYRNLNIVTTSSQNYYKISLTILGIFRATIFQPDLQEAAKYLAFLRSIWHIASRNPEALLPHWSFILFYSASPGEYRDSTLN